MQAMQMHTSVVAKVPTGHSKGLVVPASLPLAGRVNLPVAHASNRTRGVATRAMGKQVNAAAVVTEVDWEQLATELDVKSPLEIMDHALKTFGDGIAIAFSGAEDVALIEYAHLTGRPYRVFSLDTGRLNPETYRLFDSVEKHYGIRIEYTFPDTQEVVDLVREKGMFSFYEDGHGECCRVRKVRPLRKQLTTLKAWITGQRKDQSPVVQVDPVFEGVTGGAGSLIKYNPLSNITSAEVWNFLRVMGVPTNELHACGYISIGCEPCTRAVLPNQHEREGRWWWEDATAKECGLHSGNVVQGAVDQAADEATKDLWAGDSVVKSLNKDQLAALKAGPRSEPTLVVLYAPWCQYCKALEPSYEALAKEMEGSGVSVAKFQADVERCVAVWVARCNSTIVVKYRDFAAGEFGLKTFPTLVLLPQQSEAVIKYPSERRDVETLRMWLKTTTGY